MLSMKLSKGKLYPGKTQVVGMLRGCEDTFPGKDGGIQVLVV